MKEVILDTDMLSYFFKQQEDVVSRLTTYLQVFGYINLSVVTYYEVMNGLFYRGSRRKIAQFQEFVFLNKVIPLTKEIAATSARIYADLKHTGNIIEHNDVLIAGTALEQGLVLVTNNVKHFGRIEHLMLDNWKTT